MKIKKKNGGFVALISAVLVAVSLLSISANLSMLSFYGRSNVLDTEFKMVSSYLADGCASVVISKVKKEIISYNPINEVVSMDGGVCVIESISVNSPKSNQIMIKIKAEYKQYFTKLEIVMSEDMSIFSWQELP